jgi:hypothetical protein
LGIFITGKNSPASASIRVGFRISRSVGCDLSRRFAGFWAGVSGTHNPALGQFAMAIIFGRDRHRYRGDGSRLLGRRGGATGLLFSVWTPFGLQDSTPELACGVLSRARLQKVSIVVWRPCSVRIPTQTCSSPKPVGSESQSRHSRVRSSVQTTKRYLGTRQDLIHAPNDGIKLKVAVQSV